MAAPSRYDRQAHGSRVDWTKESLVIDGRPTVILGGEFHYWRVPDPARWRVILTQYKAMGLNAIRIYCHWGYHSPAPGIYIFDRARDVDYLLSLCRELNLWVIAACGPYICAETQGGGYPTWLIAKRQIRIRHLKHSFRKKWDDEFHAYCMEWWAHICPIFAKHERASDPAAPVIAFQVENELSASIALTDEVLKLADGARQHGIKSLIFHNDAMPEGSFAKGENGTDLYGVDLYFTFAPKDGSQDCTSCLCVAFTCAGCVACTQAFGCNGLGINGSQTKALKCLFRSPLAPPHKLPPLSWKTMNFAKSIDSYEKQMRVKIGGRAASGPPIMAETQVGWINQWGRTRGYDDLYDFFGSQFSATLLASLTAQGMTCINFYIPYGGTNYGTSGDTEVYTSYDYSGLIREFGFFSERARHLRLVNLFVRSFALSGDLVRSHPVPPPTTTTSSDQQPRGLICSIPSLLIRIRAAQEQQKASFAFLRNFTAGDLEQTCSIAADGVVLRFQLSAREAAILPLRYPLPAPAEPYQVLMTSLKICARSHYANADLWVSKGTGQLVLNRDDRPTNGSPATLLVSWASLDTQSITAETTTRVCIGPNDPNAHTSLLSAPLEELPMHTTSEESALSAAASTEATAGFCYTIAIHKLPCIVSVAEEQQPGVPLLRLLCLSPEDASTLTMQLDSNTETYAASLTQRPTMISWGAEEINFLNPEGSILSVDRRPEESNRVFVLHDATNKTGIEMTSVPGGRPLPVALSKILPGCFFHDFAAGLPSTGEIPKQDPWETFTFDWRQNSERIAWKSIDYATERDPLDHHFTSGHISYRCRFQTSSKRVVIKVNVRHIASVWINGSLVGGQITYSHNLISAGAMNFCDFTWAGNQAYDLSPHLVDGEEEQELVILVHSLGQSRNPFMVDDIRNRRGLLSAKFSAGSQARNVQWDIFGVPVSTLSDPFSTCGLPCERAIVEEKNSDGWPWTPTERMSLPGGGGLSWFRCDFTSASMESKDRIPVRLSARSVDRVSAFMWVNGLFVGIYVSYLGPQQEFYVMDGVLNVEKKKNRLVVAAYGPSGGAILQIKVLPWTVDGKSGNVKEEAGGGKDFHLCREVIRLEELSVAESRKD